MPDFSSLNDARLLDAEAGLHQLFDQRAHAGLNTAQHEEAHSLVAKELRERGLLYLPLDKSLAKSKGNTKTNDTDDERTDAQKPAGVGSTGNSEARGGTEEQDPDDDPSQEDGPTIKKFAADSNSGPPNRGSHPDKDDGLRQKGKTKSGKGGESNRTQDETGGDVDGDKDDKNDGTLGYIKALDAAAAAITPEYEVYLVAKAAGSATPHAFSPVINVCRTCRQHGSTHSADHPMVPVRDVCRTCKGPQADHVSKALGTDLSIFKELPQLSNEDRMKMAEQGIAMPDGSFPIPNEAFLHAAIGLVGQAPDPQAAMNHIIERAQAMGMEHALPAAWGVQGPSATGAPALQPGAHGGAAAGAGAAPATAPNAGPAKDPGGTGLPVPGAPGAGAAGAAGAPSPAAPVSPATGASGAPDGGVGGGIDPLDPAKRKPPAPADMSKAITLVDDAPYPVVKSFEEDRYTLAPVYLPNTVDAHGEWATADDLQKSMWGFVEKTGATRDVYLQHSTVPAGKWVEIMSWPHEVNAQMMKSVDGVRKSVPVVLPANTVYMGVRWNADTWDLIKAQHINGLSMGGTALRIEADPTS